MSFAALNWAWNAETGSPGRKLVLIGLAQFANEENEAWPSQQTIAKRTEQSERTVREHLSWLEENGFISSEKRTKPDGKKTSDLYVLNIESHRQISPPANFATGEKQQKTPESHRQISPVNIQYLNTNPPVIKTRAKKAVEITLDEFIQTCKDSGEKAIPENDAVMVYADSIGLPKQFVRFAWVEFKRTYSGQQKKYKCWRLAFGNYVRKNYGKLWFVDANDGFSLTTAGKQIEKELSVCNG